MGSDSRARALLPEPLHFPVSVSYSSTGSKRRQAQEGKGEGEDDVFSEQDGARTNRGTRSDWPLFRRRQSPTGNAVQVDAETLPLTWV